MFQAGDSEETEIHKSSQKIKKGKIHVCPTCGKTFSFACNLFRHEKNIHKKVRVCKIEGCLFQCSSQRKLTAHMESEHYSHCELTKETLCFDSLENFYIWKLKEEVQNFVCFTKVRGDIELANSTHRHYVCALTRRINFKKQPKSEGGKNETGCPARILLRECKENGIVSVTYHKAHSHNISFSGSEHLPMPECMRHDIKEKLKAGLTPDQISWEIQRKNKSELALAIGIYNRKQNVSKNEISGIQKMMMKKGILKGVIPEDSETEDIAGALGGEMGNTEGLPAGCIGGESVIFDGEVQEDMEVVHRPGEADIVLNQPFIAKDSDDMEKPKKKKKNSPQKTGTQNQEFVNPLFHKINDNFNVSEILQKVKVLITSGQVKSADFPNINESVQELSNILSTF